MKRSKFHGFIKFFGSVSVILFILSSCRSVNEIKTQSEIDNIASRFVPDQRVAICKVKSMPGEKGTLVLTGETTDLNAKNEIIKTLSNNGMSLIDSIVLLPDTIRSKEYMGLVTLSVINLRKEPDHSSELVSQAILGTPVLILKKVKSWILIQTPDKYISWTEASSIRSMTRVELTERNKSERVIYLESTGWLYNSISDNSGVIGDLVGGSIIEKIGESNGYVNLILPDGRKGFVKKQHVMDLDSWKNAVNCTGENVCKVAMTFLGLPYLWGGSSTKGVDCSGFVQAVFFRNGLILSRDASLQALYGSTLDITDGYSRLNEGDLLFFGSKNNGNPRITHVAIYLGNKEYINSSGRVLINSLDSTKINYSDYRLNTLVSARRIIGAKEEMGIVPVNKHQWY